MERDFDSMFAEVEDWFVDFISSTAGENDKSAKRMLRNVTKTRRGTDKLLRELSAALRESTNRLEARAAYEHADGTPCDIQSENTTTADGRNACHKPEGRKAKVSLSDMFPRMDP